MRDVVLEIVIFVPLGTIELSNWIELDLFYSCILLKS